MFKDLFDLLFNRNKKQNVYLWNFVFEEITDQEIEILRKDKDIIPILLKLKKNDILKNIDDLRFKNSEDTRWFINWLYHDYNRMFYRNFNNK